MQSLSPGHGVRLEVSVPDERAFSLCVDCLQQLRGCSIRSQSPQTGQIEACFRMSWTSYGETLTVGLQPSGAGVTRAEILSRSRWPLVLVDWGKCRENVDTVADYLQSGGGTEGLRIIQRQHRAANAPWIAVVVTVVALYLLGLAASENLLFAAGLGCCAGPAVGFSLASIVQALLRYRSN